MALPSTGSISMDQVRIELGLSGAISLNQANVRTLAGKPSGTISMSDLRGKSAIVTVTAQALVVAGGGGTFTHSWNVSAQRSRSGSGGGGGFIEHSSFNLVQGTTYTVVVGAGGAGAPNGYTPAGRGGNSSAFGMTAFGGGAGTVGGITTNSTGGSGGGMSKSYIYDEYTYDYVDSYGPGAAATQTSNGGGIGYGTAGEASTAGAHQNSGRGGGAGGIATGRAWNGVTYAKGGDRGTSVAGAANTGNGAASGSGTQTFGAPIAGGSGIVRIRWPKSSGITPASITGGTLVTSDATYYYLNFNASGSFTF